MALMPRGVSRSGSTATIRPTSWPRQLAQRSVFFCGSRVTCGPQTLRALTSTSCPRGPHSRTRILLRWVDYAGALSLSSGATQRGNAVNNVHVRLRRAERSTRTRSFTCWTEGVPSRPPTLSGAATAAHSGRRTAWGAAAQTTPTLSLLRTSDSLSHIVTRFPDEA